MPASVTELALLTIPPLPLSPALIAGLARAKAAMERFSGQPFNYLLCEKQQQDLNSTARGEEEQQQQCLFIIGGWPSVEFHMEQWIPCEENQALVRDLGELGVGVRWMWHLGVEREIVQRELFGVEKEDRVKVWRGSVLKDRVGGVEGVEGEEGNQEGRGGERAGEKAKGRLEGMGRAWRLDDGFMAKGEAEKSFRREGKRDEIVMLVRCDAGGGTPEKVENVLEGLKAVADSWESRECVILDV